MTCGRRSRWAAALIATGLLAAVTALSCGDAPAGGASPRDASVGDATFADDFAGRVRVVIAQGGTPSTCASPLPAVPVAGADEARAAVRAFVAGVMGVAPEALAVTIRDCGSPSLASCASLFQHDLYKSNGIYGAALYPLAQELESRGTSVEDTIWVATVDGLSSAAAVCISGIVDGVLVGMIMFNERQDCP